MFYFSKSDIQNELVDVESCNDLLETDTHPIPVSIPSASTYCAVDTIDTDDDIPQQSTSKLESTAGQVKQKFAQGCECAENNCFSDLSEEAVFRHRLNIAELTREEHDMYLMGVTMACLGSSGQTHRNKERQRQRATYVHKGKRVCLDAFLYLENVTQYHLKRIRQHVMTQGVVPRVHGNMGKKPHNTFSLDMYKCAEHFIKQTISEHQASGGGSGVKGDSVFLVTETRSSIYEKFRQSTVHAAGTKVMGYTTFRHFIKKQFPYVRFATTVPSPKQNKRKMQHKVVKSGTNGLEVSRNLEYSSKMKVTQDSEDT